MAIADRGKLICVGTGEDPEYGDPKIWRCRYEKYNEGITR